MASRTRLALLGFLIVAGFFLGFLLQWPTVLTLLMFPVLVTMYVRLARREEREVRAAFGAEYDRYAAATPGFVPRLGRPRRVTSSSASRGEPI